MQDSHHDDSLMEEEDTDYVDIPIKVVTNADIAASWLHLIGMLNIIINFFSVY